MTGPVEMGSTDFALRLAGGGDDKTCYGQNASVIEEPRLALPSRQPQLTLRD
jgi:hypothetical protein